MDRRDRAFCRLRFGIICPKRQPFCSRRRKALGTDDEFEPDLYRALLDAAPDAMVAVDGAGRIRLANRQAELLFGYDRSELIGTAIERLVPERVRVVHRDHRGSYAAHPRTRPLGAATNLTAVRKDGTEFPADIALSSIRTSGGFLVSAAVRDMTSRVEAERERRLIQEELHEARLRQAQRLETVGQLAGGIAHDFNNLLAVILNYSELLAERLSDAQMREDVEAIQGAASRAADLTRQLLAFARRDVTQPTLVDVNAVVTAMEKLLRRALGENIEFAASLAPDLARVRADAAQVEQVFMNLAVNARDAMPDGGRLLVETKNVELDEAYASVHPGTSPGKYVRLSVADTGVGMSPEVRARAFEPFFTTKPTGSGTGLGLATVYGIVTRAGGNIRLYSELGRGTLVAVHLPVARGEEEGSTDTSVSVPEPSAPIGSGQTVLLVEDEQAMLAAAERILVANGYRVVARSTPSRALELLQDARSTIDLLLVDVVMPGMSGVQVARRARDMRPTLPVLFMSGYAHEVVERQGAIEAGGTLVQKPFTRKELLTAVHEALSKTRSANG